MSGGSEEHSSEQLFVLSELTAAPGVYRGMRLLPLFILAMAVPIAPAQSLQFDVATVKPASEEQFMAAIRAGQMPHTGIKIDKGRAEFGYQPLIALIGYAYGLPAFQLTGPEMLKTDRFDIVAKMPTGATDEQAPEMLRALLKERFGLTIHREKKEVQCALGESPDRRDEK